MLKDNSHKTGSRWWQNQLTAFRKGVSHCFQNHADAGEAMPGGRQWEGPRFRRSGTLDSLKRKAPVEVQLACSTERCPRVAARPGVIVGLPRPAAKARELAIRLRYYPMTGTGATNSPAASKFCSTSPLSITSRFTFRFLDLVLRLLHAILSRFETRK